MLIFEKSYANRNKSTHPVFICCWRHFVHIYQKRGGSTRLKPFKSQARRVTTHNTHASFFLQSIFATLSRWRGYRKKKSEFQEMSLASFRHAKKTNKTKTVMIEINDCEIYRHIFKKYMCAYLWKAVHECPFRKNVCHLNNKHLAPSDSKIKKNVKITITGTISMEIYFQKKHRVCFIPLQKQKYGCWHLQIC